MRHLSAHGAATLLVVLGVAVLPLAAKDRLPYEVGTRVSYGDPKGPERLRRELQLQVVRALDAANCAAGVSGVRDDRQPETDLLLQVTLNEFEDSMRYDSSIAQRTSPNAAPHEERTRVTAQLAMNVVLDLSTLPDGRSVRRERFHVAKGYRPRMDEDPRYEVESLLVEAVARDVTRFLCKGRKKLELEIESAAADH